MTDINLKDKVCIVGVGETEFVRGTERSLISLHAEAALNALEDAGLKIEDVDGVIPNPSTGVSANTEQYMVQLGLRDIKLSFTKHQGGASMVASLQEAVTAIACGVASCVLFIAGRKGYSEQRISAMGAKAIGLAQQTHLGWVDEFEKPFGNIGVGEWFGAPARRHMHEYGTTSRHFGAIAVACRKHASLNPKAVMRKPITVEDHQESKVIVDPFHLLDFSLETDGAGAFLITSAERAKGLKKKPVYIMGVAEGHPDVPLCFTAKESMTELQGHTRAAKRAFAMAEVSPKDVDAAQFMDGVTYTVLSQIEDSGFCKKGEGGPFVEGGRIELGGELPVNTSGGSLSEAHVSSINHVIEATRQLRGECAERQVRNAEIVLVGTYGDFGEGGVAILRR